MKMFFSVNYGIRVQLLLPLYIIPFRFILFIVYYILFTVSICYVI